MARLARGGGLRLLGRLGLALLVIGLAVTAAALSRSRGWFGRPRLQLVALDASGLFGDSISLPRSWADTSFRGAYGATARVPLILGVRNVGEIAGGARGVELSVPAYFRLETADGRELPHTVEPGNPLVRYTIQGAVPAVQPGRLPTVLPSADTVWLEPIVPRFYCVAEGDSVPAFVPAADPDARLLSRIDIFYSFAGTGQRGRQAGLLMVRLDPSLVERPVEPPPPSYPTVLRSPDWPMPSLGTLRRVGSATAECGPPETPMRLLSTVWEDSVGRRVIVLGYGGRARKYLFDLNRDSMVDLEMWDASGTGKFDARRVADFRIPRFLLPPPPPPVDSAALAARAADSLARLGDVGAAAGPPPPRDSTARPRPGTGPAAAPARAPGAAPAGRPPAGAPAARGSAAAGPPPPARPPAIHILGTPVAPADSTRP